MPRPGDPVTFSIGDSVVAVSSAGEILRESVVARFRPTYFETSDGAKWRAGAVPGVAVRVPESPDAPTLRHARKSDAPARRAAAAAEEITSYRPHPGGISPRDALRAAAILRRSRR